MGHAQFGPSPGESETKCSVCIEASLDNHFPVLIP